MNSVVRSGEIDGACSFAEVLTGGPRLTGSDHGELASGRVAAWMSNRAPRTLALLERAYDERHHAMVVLKREPLFDSLHGDAAFQDLVRRIGIP